ncbi:major facilitator superfamily transporter [Hyaloscypha finlandica]|nr:major facilitator superfamily transporter [Hyaloscypha finlandica]
MAGAGRVHEETGSSSQQEVVHERTPLLASNNNTSYDRSHISPDETIIDEDSEETEIDPNEFDNLLSRAESITTGLGIEVESQETAMLRGPRRYSFANGGSRAIHESPSEEDIESKPKSPFLAGVSVSTFWLIFGGVLTGNYVACFDSTIMVSSHPVITSYFKSSNSASWLSTAFLLTSTSFQPLFGRLSDTIGRKTPYVFTVTTFLIATIWCALAQSMTSFILARAVCGLGAGGMIAMGSIIMSDLVPIEIRGVYQSYINIAFGAGSTMGAALGGAIADSLGWRWEFGVQVPLIAFCVLGSYIVIPRKLGLAAGIEKQTLWEAMKAFDFKGSLLLTASITFLILGLNLGGNIFPWTHPFVLASLIIFSLAFPLFIYIESTVPLPIMPLKLILHNPRAGLILGNFVGAIIANAVMFNIPLYFQAVLLESATTSGLRLIVPSLASSVVGTATGFLITWTKRLKWLLVLGVICLVAGTVALSCMQRGLPDWAYLFFLVPSAMGQGFLFPAAFMSILVVSEQAEQAVVTSTLILWRSLGTVLGVATSSLVVQNALLVYLEKNVVGPDKEDVIEQVRKSVRAIADLEPVYREQVIDSYASALRATFFMAVILSLVLTLITLYIKLPRLGQRK